MSKKKKNRTPHLREVNNLYCEKGFLAWLRRLTRKEKKEKLEKNRGY